MKGGFTGGLVSGGFTGWVGKRGFLGGVVKGASCSGGLVRRGLHSGGLVRRGLHAQVSWYEGGFTLRWVGKGASHSGRLVRRGFLDGWVKVLLWWMGKGGLLVVRVGAYYCTEGHMKRLFG